MSVYSFICIIFIYYIDSSFINKRKYAIVKYDSENYSSKISDAIKSFKLEYYLLTTICLLNYSTILPYINFSTSFLNRTEFSKIKDRDIAEIKSSDYTRSIFIVSIILNPIIGFLQKKFGMRPMFLLLSCIFGILAIVILFNYPPIYGLICFGISYSIFPSVIWSSIGIITEKRYLVKLK